MEQLSFSGATSSANSTIKTVARCCPL